ncbi:PilN domain-containing protein [Methylomonas fluvii]|uniref:PilN domain-containing protein n=1 Tax=Methylomonas fluvii TaxID=1854564 RepID=A0ABR9D802_9GAMM|nr:PilN domain-containing protein [Methylomonas fluvii]MBD9359234.1 PilN domain-containing protein [Methylomonas fluvii]
MARINLLPWREELRKKKQQDFVAGIGAGILVTALILVVVYMYIEGIKEYQTRRNTLLQNEIAILDKRIQEIKEIEDKKNRLLTKIEVIQKLQESRPEVVHLFDELAKTTPDGIYLTKFTQAGSVLTLDGKAESNARVSAYMRAIDNSPWMNTSVLTVIKGEGKKDGQMNDFTLTAKQGKKIDKPQSGAVK